MYVLISLFAASLFLIALFFAVKEREIHAGRPTAWTRFLRSRSPEAELAAERLSARAASLFQKAIAGFSVLYEKMLRSLVWAIRAFIVALAERMIHAVRGEKLVAGNGGSSVYLKQLKEHKDNTAGDAPQV